MEAARVCNSLSLICPSSSSSSSSSIIRFQSSQLSLFPYLKEKKKNYNKPSSNLNLRWKSRSSLPIHERNLCVSSSASHTIHEFSDSTSQSAGSFFRSVLSSMEQVYVSRNPTAKSVLDLVHSCEGDQICYDHFAFRTFGVDGYGIDSMSKFFLDYGYMPRDELRFPAKKLKALWFTPPDTSQSGSGSGVNGPLPRIFISELIVDEMSSQAQEVIRKYTKISPSGNKYAALASALGSLTWEVPLYSDYQQLSRESEYAAWTLVNGFALNHATISTHRLKSHMKNINSLNNFIERNGFKLNSEGGALKVSPDGLLLQSSTVADSRFFQFADGVTESVPCSYIEFAERLVLPQFRNLPANEIKEFHRREGFEVGNADKIFESTSMDQLSRRAA